MPLLDVSDILLDPDFVGPIKVLRRTASVNQFGENQISTVVANTVGSVQPAPYKDILKLPEALRTSDMKSFFVRAEIRTSGYPDVLEVDGKRYQAVSVESWTHFGAGWHKGICVEEKPA